MKKAILTIGVCVVIAAIGIGALQYFKPEVLQKFTKFAGVAPAPEVKVEDFYLLDHKGRAQRLYRNSGSKAVVLISTANGCPTIRDAAPKIKELQDKFG